MGYTLSYIGGAGVSTFTLVGLYWLLTGMSATPFYR